MKKLVFFAAVLTMFGMAACNSELGPEYTTWPEVTNMTLTPRIAHLTQDDEIEPVVEGQPVMMSCYFSNTYGWSRIYMSYRTLTPDEYEGKSDSEINLLWLNKFQSTEDIYKTMDHTVTFESPMKEQPFAFSIPGQTAGTLVRWDFGYFNQYGLGTGYMAAGKLPQNEYKVVASGNSDEHPDSPAEPIE